jgi:hypothetical protein
MQREELRQATGKLKLPSYQAVIIVQKNGEKVLWK